jgi:hypothetical protein
LCTYRKTNLKQNIVSEKGLHPTQVDGTISYSRMDEIRYLSKIIKFLFPIKLQEIKVMNI